MADPSPRNPLYSALAAAGSLLVAGSCCLPLGTFWLAAGAAGLSSVVDRARPYLMSLSVALIALGFWQAHRSRQCNRRPNRFHSLLLWTSALMVAAGLFFPQTVAGLMAGKPASATSGSAHLEALNLNDFEQRFDRIAGVKLVVLLSPT